MPKNAAADAGHGVFTDHSIPRVPLHTLPKSTSWRLKGFSNEDAGDRELGLAYAEVGVRTGDRRQQLEAIRLLTASPQDPEVQVRLADLLERANAEDRAFPLYVSSLHEDPNQLVALVNLGRLFGMNGHLEDAIKLWREALKQNPCLVEAGRNLEIALRANKDAPGADAVHRAQSFCVFE